METESQLLSAIQAIEQCKTQLQQQVSQLIHIEIFTRCVGGHDAMLQCC